MSWLYDKDIQWHCFCYYIVNIDNDFHNAITSKNVILHRKADMRVEISVISGPVKGRNFIFDRPSNCVFGRSADAHISVPDAFISRHHFALNIAASECKLRDLDSKNGVVVNGIRYGGQIPPIQGMRQAPINEVRLRDGDEIMVGTTRLIVNIRREDHLPSAGMSPISEKKSAHATQEGRMTLQSRSGSAPVPQNEMQRPAPEKKSSTTSHSPKRQVALLVLDVAGSTQHVVRLGDSYFIRLIQDINARVKQHPFALDMVFLKSTGDGFIALFNTAEIAFSIGKSFLNTPPHPDIQLRMGLHWGGVKLSLQNDVNGIELHKAMRLEGVQLADRLKAPEQTGVFPSENRILLTEEAMKQLPGTLQAQCRPVGLFRLKDLDETSHLWLWQPGKK